MSGYTANSMSMNVTFPGYLTPTSRLSFMECCRFEAARGVRTFSAYPTQLSLALRYLTAVQMHLELPWLSCSLSGRLACSVHSFNSLNSARTHLSHSQCLSIYQHERSGKRRPSLLHYLVLRLKRRAGLAPTLRQRQEEVGQRL